ncbi:MAG TPA: hypothetical protein VGJ33_11320 [Candidatus Angelobacter sp.]|jgi:hypothetical protein
MTKLLQHILIGAIAVFWFEALVAAPIAGQEIPQKTLPCANPESASRLLIKKQINASCEVIPFDRLQNKINKQAPDDAYADVVERRDIVESIKSSKVLISGSLLRVKLAGYSPESCEAYDWKIVAQGKESPSVVIYGASDVGAGMCGKNESGATFLVAIPLDAIWAEITPFIARNHDPMHKGPSAAPSAQNPASSPKNCNGEDDPSATSTIEPCDRNDWPVRWLYNTAFLFYNPFTQPGSAQGTISVSPVLGGGSQKLSYDLQFNPIVHIPGGWIGLPVTFEKDSNVKANLDSLTMGLSYEVRFVKTPNWAIVGDPDRFTIRKPQLQFRIGPELAPTSPRDLNLMGGITLRVPFAFSFHRQPSSVTFFPVLGIEDGQNIKSHLVVSDTIIRGVAGADASFRWPFDLTHNFFGDKPVTIDYSYRMRWLANDEPMTDVADGGSEIVSHRRHSYWRSSLNAPLSANFQFKLTVQHGSLPPDFRILDYSLNLGLTFTNPGTTEH